MALRKSRQTDQWNRVEIPETDSCKYRELIVDRGTVTIQWSKDSVFNKWYWHNWASAYKKKDQDADFIPFTKLNHRGVEI